MALPFIPNPAEGVRIALRAMLANKLRSALTVLGVVIGVATVMAMASIVQGVRAQVFNTMDRAGPSVFYVIRYMSETPLNPDRLPREVRVRPPVAPADAALLKKNSPAWTMGRALSSDRFYLDYRESADRQIAQA